MQPGRDGSVMDRLGPYDLDTIYTGDAKELSKKIPDNSIDLIFTDPVYDRIEDYEWLAETAARVLKDDRACLVWALNPLVNDCTNAMGKYLVFERQLTLFMSGVTVGTHVGRLFVKTSPCIFMSKGQPKLSKQVWDISIGVSNSQKNGKHHKWGKDPTTVFRWIEAFTQPGAIVLDPFTGGGTVPAVCKMLSRRYLAFEIDPETADLARQRVLMTQPPLIVPEPRQLELA
jgi:DNA modification methylase